MPRGTELGAVLDLGGREGVACTRIGVCGCVVTVVLLVVAASSLLLMLLLAVVGVRGTKGSGCLSWASLDVLICNANMQR